MCCHPLYVPIQVALVGKCLNLHSLCNYHSYIRTNKLCWGICYWGILLQDEHSKLYDARETASVEESLRKPEDSVSSSKIDQTSTTDDKNSNPYYTFNDPTIVGSCVLESFRNSQEIYLVDLPQRVEYKITISEAQPVRKCNNSLQRMWQCLLREMDVFSAFTLSKRTG